MKKLAIALSASALVVAVPAWAAKPAHPTHPSHPTHPAHPQKGGPKGGSKGHAHKSCDPRNEGYSARGTLASASLTPAAKKNHYDGTLSVDLTRANHGSATGSQSYTLTDARVRFGKGLSATTVGAGDSVRVHGKTTVLPHGCSSTGFTPTITVHTARIRAPKS